jgi:tetratricopeptide (TPR) repeat protein
VPEGTELDSASVGVQQLGLEGAFTEEEVERRTRQMLSRALNTRRVVAVVGSGISAAYGYPTWQTLAQRIVTFTRDHGHPSQEARELLDAFLQKRDSLLSPADRIVLILDVCDDVLTAPGEASRLHDQVAEIIREPRQHPLAESQRLDPLRLIMQELGIRRFMTTNYDDEIERAFERTLGGDHAFTIQEGLPEQLVQFAVAAPGFETRVFHLHGMVDRPKSMVVTERDYQFQYLQEDPERRAYRDALRLAFAANPVLFLGASLEEPDLLRPLREFVSDRHRDPRERPLFALLPRPDATQALERRRFLYTRYGVKVLYYDPQGPDPTAAFCDEVKRVAGGWTTWWKSWQRKPAVRKAQFGTKSDGQVMVRHYTDHEEFFTEERDYGAVVQALNTLGPGGGAVVVVGDAGAGKGALGVRLVEERDRLPAYQKRFFATMHFTNDFLSTIDAVSDFLAGGEADSPEGGRTPVERFAAALASGPHLVVIGGLDRLLAPTEPPPANSGSEPQHGASGYPLPYGAPLTPEVKEFLAAILALAEAGADGQSHVVLTSSVWPASLPPSLVKDVVLRGMSLDGAAQLLKPPIDRELAGELCHILRGHVYALWLLQGVLDLMPDAERSPWLARLAARLSALELTRRAEVVVQSVVSLVLDRYAGDERKLRREVLQRVSLFATPVEPAAVAASCRCAVAGVESALNDLATARLLLRIHGFANPAELRYTAHTTVRAHVLHSLGSLPDVPGEPQRFDLPGFSTEASEAQPGTPPGMKTTTESLDALLTSGSRTRAGVRAAFSLMRARWTATAIGRHAALELERTASGSRPHMDAYMRRLALLLNAVRAQLPRHWLRETEPRGDVEHAEAVLYADELAWLYNELALAAFCQGSQYDAYALYRMGQDVNAFAERRTYGYRWCESEINLAMVQMERARLSRARYHLDNAVRAAVRLGDPQIEARARGHLGLVHHLSGDYTQAEDLYETALDMLKATGNRRAISIFRRHRGDLRRLQGQVDLAADDIRASIAAAESGRHPDLLHFARIAEANLALTQGRSGVYTTASPQKLLLPALEFARRTGLPKLEADAYMVQATIALQQGETDFAGRLATRCLALAAGLGMQLRVTRALLVTGRVAKARGHLAAAQSLFRSVIRLAERQGYQLQVENAERQLMAMGWPSESPGALSA